MSATEIPVSLKKAQQVEASLSRTGLEDDDIEIADISDVQERIDFIVPQTDDPNTLTVTCRSVLLGTFWTVILSIVNTLFTFRTNNFAVSAFIACILSYPMGLGMAAALPRGILNPGPFTLKEHVLVFLMASNAVKPFGMDNVVAIVSPKLMNNTKVTFVQSLFFILITQFLGFGLAGTVRRFLVRPTAMWWPATMNIIALLTSFHNVPTTDTNTGGTRYKRSRFVVFWIAFAGMFVYTWLPEYFMPVLQAISTICLFSGAEGTGLPTPGQMSITNAVAGSVTNGVGVLGLTFDWAFIDANYVTSPFWASVCFAGGNILFSWIVTPILFATNVWGISDLISKDQLNPYLNSIGLYSGNISAKGSLAAGRQIKASFFYNPTDNFNLNVTAYNEVAPVHITAFFVVTYATAFMLLTASISHVILWYGPDILRQAKNAIKQARDEVDSLDKHVQIMEAYSDIPDWAYIVWLIAFIIAALFLSLFSQYSMPWWGIFLCLAVNAIFILPFGIIVAISGFSLVLNVLSEFIIGLILPGQTIPVMVFKSFNTNILLQAVAFSGDLKLGQYLHIHPYAVVSAQIWSTLLNSIIAVATAYWVMFDSGSLLTQTQWQYTVYVTAYNAGAIWGAIGPARFFGVRSLYQNLMWCFLAGAILPILPWLGNRYLVKSKYWHYINIPLLTNMTQPGGLQSHYLMGLVVSWYCQIHVFRKDREFFEKYIYVIGSAFQSGAASTVTIIAILVVAGAAFTQYNVFNPQTSIVTLDYYCYPSAGYKDWGCEYYLSQGKNVTASGQKC
ncbi:hypothetical protein HK100_005898 [Physocladia obscura]|uniref:Uncharacterized protein n=1 Tax=Physocladia obscura TaxID=109957 RepID=A0AAD5XGB3_9FUNG|nr:hypothetical protein HK100_005898 [Physocladia obscura]